MNFFSKEGDLTSFSLLLASVDDDALPGNGDVGVSNRREDVVGDPVLRRSVTRIDDVRFGGRGTPLVSAAAFLLLRNRLAGIVCLVADPRTNAGASATAAAGASFDVAMLLRLLSGGCLATVGFVVGDTLLLLSLDLSSNPRVGRFGFSRAGATGEGDVAVALSAAARLLLEVWRAIPWGRRGRLSLAVTAAATLAVSLPLDLATLRRLSSM